jgi:hypothetical protein
VMVMDVNIDTISGAAHSRWVGYGAFETAHLTDLMPARTGSDRKPGTEVHVASKAARQLADVLSQIGHAGEGIR